VSVKRECESEKGSEQPESNRWPFDFRSHTEASMIFHYSQTLYQLSYARKHISVGLKSVQSFPFHPPPFRYQRRHDARFLNLYTTTSPTLARHSTQGLFGARFEMGNNPSDLSPSHYISEIENREHDLISSHFNILLNDLQLLCFSSFLAIPGLNPYFYYFSALD
jgi:hypothetical protein